MRSGRHIVILVALAGLLAAGGVARAQWVEDGVAIAATPELQGYPVTAPDGEGGVIVAWQDKRLSSYEDIFAQRLDAHGRALWTAGGILVCGQNSIQNHPRIAPDGQGGAVLVWWDQRNGSGSELYAQRLDADGNAVWTAGGVRVHGYAWSVDQYAIAGDGLGGALIAWYDAHEDYVTHRAYAQRLAAADGARLWGADGTAVCDYVSEQNYPTVVAAGDGGGLLVWSDDRNGDLDIYGQWIRAGGGRVWSVGMQMCGATGTQWQSTACASGRGGIIAAWLDTRHGGTYDLYAAGFDTNFTYIMYDVPLCTAVEDQHGVVLSPDGAGGAFFAWYDERPEYGSDIYAQHVSDGGTVQWTTDGVAVCTYGGYQSSPQVTADGLGGLICAWSDGRAYPESDCYAQRLDAAGDALWAVNGVALSTAAGTQAPGGIVSDGAGGAIVAWHDSQSPDWDVYGQRVERNGYWGYPCPVIADVADVPFDQGGRLALSWDASRLDVFPERVVTHYSVWRSLGAKGLAALLDAGAAGVSLPEVAADFAGPAFLLGEGKDAGAWEWLANLPAHYLAEYAYAATTLNDSMAGNPGWHHFFVAAHTDDPFEFWDSLPDSGYSVDNLAPSSPKDLSGLALFDPTGLRLSWRPNEEADLAGYRVYRGTDPGFTPGAGSLLAAPADTTLLDGGWSPAAGYCYKVSAVDLHGNESPWAVLLASEISGGGEAPAARRPFLANRPNPFNPRTTLVYALDRPATVTLRILDARGREVIVLPQGRQPAGRYEVRWDGRDARGRAAPSGLYLCRLEAGALRLAHKLSLIR